MKKLALITGIMSVMIVHFSARATHLMGGSLTYRYTGQSNGNYNYHVTLKIYRYCTGGTAALDQQALLGIFLQDPQNPNADKVWYETSIMPITSQQFITPPSPGINCNFNASVCVEEGIYESDISLPPNAGGYHLMVERCCRNGNIVNLSNPGSIGMTYYTFIPPAPVINSSPQFSDIPVPYICTGDTVTIVNNAVDPDGDVLVYSFEIPYIGYSGTTNAIPDPQIDLNPYAMPIPEAIYNPGYSLSSPFGAGGFASINPVTGLTSYYIPNQGFFVVVIEIKEYRNGQLISAIRRDLQLIAIACPPNNPPNLSTTGGSGNTTFNVVEGQTLCFPSIFVDPNGDSLFLTVSGNIFNGAVVNPPATMANASGNGIVNSLFCWSTECGMSQPAPYQFLVSVIDNGCPPMQTNVIYSINVLPAPPNPTPSLSITANPAGPICTGTPVTFTATPTFGGTNPQYQWFLNGNPVGSNSTTWTSSTLNNGDIITCTMVSNSICVSSFNAVSNAIVMTVNPFIAPSVTISAVPAGPVCAGTNVTFTAVPVNPGATPVYQWQVNGVNVGTNSPTYSSSTLTMGSTVSLTLTADANCPAAVSNVINMTVYPVVVPQVTIAPNVSGAICPGTSVTFTATANNGGSTPSFQWQVNGVNVGTNSNSYTSSTWNNGDQVQVIMTSSANCPNPSVVNSNVVVMTVNAPTTPSVSIAASPAMPVCAGQDIIFTATPVLGGTAPSYQWKVNGVNAGTNSSTFITSTLQNGDAVSVTLTSNSPCATTPTANSNVIVVAINPNLTPSVSISNNPAFPVCSGTAVTFTAAGVNGGSSPSYQWQVNGVNSGANSAVFTTTMLTNGAQVRCIMTSNLLCKTAPNATSNVIQAVIIPNSIPSVTISSNPASPVCDGTSVTFTATPVNGGATPTYQWTVNGIATGSNSPVFTTSSLANNSNIQVSMTSSAACPVPPVVNSNVINMTVNPNLVPQVTIIANPAGPICAGDPVTFTATPVNGGPSPIYQWKINGINAGTNSPTFTSSTLNNNDRVEVVMTSNATCVQPAIDTSNQIIMTVNPVVTPVIAITANPAGPICDGTSVTFNANIQNGGTAPAYQWFINGNPAGNNSSITTSTLQNGDVIHAVLTSNEVCLSEPTDTSNQIVMTVNPNLTPAVTIVSSADTICPNDFVQFTATPVNGGSNPAYQWFVNGIPSGNNSPVFSTNSLVNGDAVRVRLTSSETCLTQPTALSNIKVIFVNPNLTPFITFTVQPDTVVCDGTPVTFTSSWTNGGISPHFQWFVNGNPAGTDTSVFSSSTLNNGDSITVVLTSNAICVLPPTDTSFTYIFQEDPILTPSITISANPPGTFCDGMNITYSSAVNNEGSNPLYQWTVNGNPLGITTPSFNSTTMQDGDTLQAVLTSSVHCPSVNPVFSNQIIIDRLPPLDPEITGTPSICYGKEAFIEVTTTGGNGGPYYYTWNQNLGNQTSYILSPPVTTTYTVSVTDSCSTPRTDSFTITVFELPVPSFTIKPPQATILNPFFDFIDASQNTAQWLWNFGDGTSSNIQYPQHTYLEAGYYTVQLIATSNDGCVDSLSRELYVEEVTTIYIPNSFSPNSDGMNDMFMPIGHAIPPYEMIIMNRWGNVVFSSSNGFEGWNGKIKGTGTDAPNGVYVYRIRFEGELKQKEFTGRVNVIR
jgi:gliding motility-associated-like protein